MYLDLHTHSVSSDDSRANVEQYVKWIGVLRRKGHQIDGFVLTEHRKFDFDKDYSEIGAENDVLILKGSELDTDLGHFLVYGVTEELTQRVNFSDVNLDALKLVDAAEETGAVAIPAHPGRFGIGLIEFTGNGRDFSRLRAAERFNGSNRPGEQERAEELISQLGLPSTGGSDAHLVSAIGKCMTRFDGDIASVQDLVAQLKNGNFEPVWLDDTKKQE
ncbi:MAG: PHP domain-containing protein [Chloroflexi bacterium]|nr:PHP domain-containing protein [Chloroflexota bacterium]